MNKLLFITEYAIEPTTMNGPYSLPKIAPDFEHVNKILSKEFPSEFYDYCWTNGNLVVMNSKFLPIATLDFNQQIQLGIWNF
jgi:hypothetical protein